MAPDAVLPDLPSWKIVAAIVVGFFALTLGIYGQSLSNEFVRWDDGMLIYENPSIREITPRSLKHIFTSYDPELYIPLTFLTYQIDYQISGTNPFLYHLDNLVLHTLNALFVAWLLYLLSRRKWLALLCGILFAVHPLHTEAVEWASARKDVLSTFFYLSSLVAYVRYQGSHSKRMYWLSVALCLLGLLSKVMVITLPVVLLLIDDLRGRKWWSKEALLEKIPFAFLAILFGIIGVLGKTQVVGSSSMLAKILMAGKSAVFYIGKILVPTHLSLLYPYTKEITPASPDFFVPMLICLMIAAGALFVRFRTRAREIFFGLALFAVTVAPTFLNFAKGGETDVYFASDRYAYLPSVGILFAVGILVSICLEKLGANRLRSLRWPGLVISGLMVAVFCFLSYRQSLVWADTESLFLNVLKEYPESSYVAHNNLGNVYRLRNELDRAIDEYQQAISIRPNVRTLSNLGATYRKKNMFPEALEAYARALTLAPNSPIAHYGLGIVYAAQGRNTEARAEYEKAIVLDPKYEEAHANLGTLALEEENPEMAINHYLKALEINPYLIEAQYNLGNAYLQIQKIEEAKKAYLEAIRLQPTFTQAHINLGQIFAATGDRDGAIKQFKDILKYDPTNAIAKSALRQLGE